MSVAGVSATDVLPRPPRAPGTVVLGVPSEPEEGAPESEDEPEVEEEPRPPLVVPPASASVPDRVAPDRGPRVTLVVAPGDGDDDASEVEPADPVVSA